MSASKQRLVRLNLGCGDDIRPGYVNHDVIRHRPDIDVSHDLRAFPWPWPDRCAAEIRLIDVVEHLPEVVPVLDECWRVLTVGGVLHLRVPHYLHENAWLDPTHRRAFHLNSFDYFDPETDSGAEYGFYTSRKWKVVRKVLEDSGNVAVSMRKRRSSPADLERWKTTGPYHAWRDRVERAVKQMSARMGPADAFILVDENKWGTRDFVSGRRRIPFLERNGYYWGPPPDDKTAIREVKRLRRSGAAFMVFAWPAFWWLDHYAGFNAYLRSSFRCVMENDRLVMFDLRR